MGDHNHSSLVLNFPFARHGSFNGQILLYLDVTLWKSLNVSTCCPYGILHDAVVNEKVSFMDKRIFLLF